MKAVKKVYEFEQTFDGELIVTRLGRFLLGKGSLVRIVFTPEGIQLIIPSGFMILWSEKRAKDNGEILWLEDIEYEGPEAYGLAKPPGKELK